MARYQVQWWHPTYEKWMNAKRFIFKHRALKYITKQIIQLSCAKKWQMVDMKLSTKILTRIVVTVERRDQ